MTSSDRHDWHMCRHPGIFEKIMLNICLDSPESLYICRQVCRSWNYMIMNKIWENPTKLWGTIIQGRIERSWDFLDCQDIYPSDSLISRAKLLGKHRIRIIIVHTYYYCFSNQRYPHLWCV